MGFRNTSAMLPPALLRRSDCDTSTVRFGGLQVLPPVGNPEAYGGMCAAKSDPLGSFEAAAEELNEGTGTGAEGTTYESWAEIPQERLKLLRMVQKSINVSPRPCTR